MISTKPILLIGQMFISLKERSTMATLTLKINEKSKAGKAILAMIDALTEKPRSGVEVVEEKSPYDPEFVKKIKDAVKRGKYTEIDPNDVWGSLGLK